MTNADRTLRFRSTLGRICVCLIALFSVQCTRGSGRDDSRASTLTIHIAEGDERSLGPLGVKWHLVFLGLAADLDGSGVQQPRLLERWEHTPDYSEWTVHLRDDLRWGDGAPVTAADVKFSLELWTHPDILYEYPGIEQITVLDSLSLRITFFEPVHGTIFDYNWLAILPEHLLSTLDRDEIFSWPFWIEPVGNGPFRYVRHVPATMTELEANPDYFGEAPKIPRVVLRYGGSSVVELLSGNVDIASGITPLDAVQLARDSRFQIYHRVQYSNNIALVWNHRNPLFRDAAVRRALTMSIDRRELHRLLNYPEDLPIFDVPALARHHLEGVVPPALPFDPERATRLLATAGWVDTDGDGTLDKDGQEFRFTLSTTESESIQAVYIQERLRGVGIAMEISTFERLALMRRTNLSYDFEAAIIPYHYILDFQDFPRSGYDNAELSRLRDGAWFSLDQEVSDQYLREFWKIFGDEVPITYLHPQISYLAAHVRVKGLKNDRDLFSMVEQLWLEEEGR